jgi:hypothetical protein
MYPSMYCYFCQAMAMYAIGSRNGHCICCDCNKGMQPIPHSKGTTLSM